MNKRLKTLFIFIICAASALILASCSNPTAPPTLAETPVPVTLKFVEFDELQVDLSQLTEGASASITSSKLNNLQMDISSLIEFNANLIKAYEEEVLIPITEGLGAIEIPIDKNIQAFEGEVTFTQFSNLLLDTLFGTQGVKLDLRDYDWDDNGVSEGCSGHTAELPVCVRFWLNDKRFIAWVFEEYPIEGTTVGKGKFKILLDDIYGIGWEVAIFYSQTVDTGESKGYEAFLKATINDPDCAHLWCQSHDEIKVVKQHMKVARDGPEEVALKSLDSNQLAEILLNNTTPETISVKATDRYVEGFDFWAGSFYRERTSGGVIVEEGEQDICARISTKNREDQTGCEDVDGQNIRIGSDPLFPDDGHPFIFATTDADVALPTNFSEAPPADFPLLPKP
jgi:hypothetical protein